LSAALSIALKNLRRRKLLTLLTFLALTLTITGFVLTVTISNNIGFQITTDYTKRTLFAGFEVGYPYFCDVVVTPSQPRLTISQQPSTLLSDFQMDKVIEIEGAIWSEPYVGDIRIFFDKPIQERTGSQLANKEWYIRAKNGTTRNFTSVDGKNFSDCEGMALGFNFAKQYNVQIGDTLIFPIDNLGGFHERPGKAFSNEDDFRGLWDDIMRVIENPWEVSFPFDLKQTLTLKVDSIFWTATPYDNYILADYKVLQEATGFDDRITCILVKLDKETEVNEFLNKILSIEGINAYIPTSRKQYFRGSGVQVAQTFSGISPSRYTKISNWQTIIVSGVATGVFIASIFYTNIYRRRWEIGLLKSIGFESSFIILLLLIEPFVLGLISGLTGFLMACLVSVLSTGVYCPFLGYIPLLSSVMHQIDMKFTLTWGVASILLSILVSMISSILPAYIASRLTPVEAMRGNSR